MAVLLGIDTGGTFTDAVLVREATTTNSTPARSEILATAKAPTDHRNLARGVAASIELVLRHAGVNAAEIALVSVSTTLATNALVEGHGEPAAMLAIGFSRRELERAALGSVVDDAHLLVLPGGHDAHGGEREPLDHAQIEAAVAAVAHEVSAFAITSQFSVRNPAHERTAAEIVRTTTAKPVTMSHELSARLDGPRRALTAALNARLLGTIARLNDAVHTVMADAGIDAPLMVVRGDGSLVTDSFAAARPVETVLSGPAASVVGGLYLARCETALVVDIGGTTTDLAVVEASRPRLASDGAVVGGHRTMVEAVDMTTIGLGGDSEVRIDTRASDGPLVLGPERAIPIGRLVAEHPDIVIGLERQLAEPTGWTSHGRFLVDVGAVAAALDGERERAVALRLSDGPLPVAVAAPTGLDMRAVERLRSRGLVRVATLTPTDAQAVLHGVDGIDAEASRLVAELLARQSTSTGAPIAPDPIALCEQVIERLVNRSAHAALHTACRVDGLIIETDSTLLAAALAHHRGAVDVGLHLAYPLVAIGAPAASWYPQVGELARTQTVVPPHADVANAIGAVVGRVRVRRACTITQPTRGQFRVHIDDQPAFGSVENARRAAREWLEEAVLADALAAGAATPEVAERWSDRVAEIDGRQVFVEGTLELEASGRPRL